jgi:16S rRNA processing protein RimM
VSDSRRIEVGRLGAAHGVRGWVRVQSFTDPPRRLFEWKRWFIGDREWNLLDARPQGNGWVALLEGIVERDAASRLAGQMILVERDQLPPPGSREHYRDDLVGFEVRNLEGALLGVVDHFVDTPANAVMVIKGAREHWVPVTPQHLREIRAVARALVVDWPEDF